MPSIRINDLAASFALSVFTGDAVGLGFSPWADPAD